MNHSKRQWLGLAGAYVKKACSILDRVIGEEQTSFDNAPEGLENSERYVKMEEAIDQMTDAQELLEEAAGLIEEAAG